MWCFLALKKLYFLRFVNLTDFTWRHCFRKRCLRTKGRTHVNMCVRAKEQFRFFLRTNFSFPSNVFWQKKAEGRHKEVCENGEREIEIGMNIISDTDKQKSSQVHLCTEKKMHVTHVLVPCSKYCKGTS